MGEHQVRDAQADAGQFEQRVRDLDRPGCLHLPETADQPGDLVRQRFVVAKPVRNRRAFEMERRGPPLGSPQDVGVELPAGTAGVENGKQQRQLQAVGRDRPEQAERPVDLDAAGAVGQPRRDVQQPVELQAPEEQAHAARIGPLQRDDDADRAQEYRLLAGRLVGGDERGAADRIESGEYVILPQVGEQRVPHILLRPAELGRRGRDHRLGLEPLRIAHGPPGRGGADEDRPPQRGGVDALPYLEPAAILDELAQPPHEPVVGLVVRHVVAGRLERRTGAADRGACGGDELLRDGQRPVPFGRPQRRHLDTSPATPRPHEINRQHRTPGGGRW